MTNPTTIDRRDVAHQTNPLGGHTQIEQEDLGKPLDADADRLPAGGQGVNRIDPKSRIPEPVKQDLGFRRTFNQGER